MILQEDGGAPEFGENGRVLKMSGVERLRAGAAGVLRPTGRLPRPTARNWVFDAALALALGTAAALKAADAVPLTGGRPLAPVLVAVATSAVLVLRRRFPLGVLWAVMAATLAAPGEAPLGALYAGIIAAYSAAAYSPYRIPTLASLPVVALLVGVFRSSDSYHVPDKYVPFLLLFPIALAANAIRSWQQRSDRQRERLAAAQREQMAALRRAVELERARIARELHDVVTHNVSVMVIQAGAARKILQTHPELAEEALLAVESGGRAAMTELRQVMGLLTTEEKDGGGSLELAPQPGIAGLSSLVDGVRKSGVPIELRVTGEPRPVSSGVELAVYRVVQEALTNMVKHAVGASATVAMEYGPRELRVEVTDTGGRPGETASEGSGRGLIGLRERLAAHGGTLRAGRRPSGGYRVSAAIPLEAR